MILNTLDNLGKFETKGNEGYFLGYSMSSKAFRIFNKRTKRVEENVHIEFLENKAIEKGSGPNWLFDIDSLTKSMNYVPVVDAGTHSTNFLSTKVYASKDEKKDVSSLRYIVLPNWGHEEHLESNLSQPQGPCNTDVPESSGNSNPTATSIILPADQLGTLTVETPIPTVSSPVLTACFSDSQKPSSATRLILKRVTNQEEIPSLDNILTLTNQFEDILGDTSNSKESNGVEADISNTEITITASPTLTLRIHRDHPKSQIIGPVDTSIQTRNKSKEVLKNKKDERGIVIKNKARLVAQGHTQKEGIDYDEVFPPVIRIKAIRLFLAYASFMGFTVYQMDVKSAFLYGTINEEVPHFDLVAYSDSDYGGASEDCKSASGGCQFLGRRLISWQCRKQTIVATSTTEAEYVAAASCCGQGTCNTDVSKSNGNSNPTTTSTNPSDDQLETLTVETPIPTASLPVSTVCFSDSQEPSSATRLISKRVTNQEEIPSLDNILTLTNQFEDILGDTSNSKVWSLVDCPKGVRPIGTKWVLKNKKDERGIVIRNKARLVAQGNTWEEGIDYDEVFAPVARIEAIRLFLAYALFMGFTVYQMDVKSAFLYGTIDEEVLMHEKFQMSAMGELNFFLGLQVLHKGDVIFLSQDKYVGDILKKFRYSDIRSSNTSMDKENPWGKDGTGKDI
nr:copia protein [Tanacetum cinerariifolium]